jgi:hypothetical protein
MVVMTLAVLAWRTMATKAHTLQCDNQMCQIDGGKTQHGVANPGLKNGDVVTPDQISPYIKGGWRDLRCPSGGQYTIGKYGETPRCSVHGTPRSGLIYKY